MRAGKTLKLNPIAGQPQPAIQRFVFGKKFERQDRQSF